MNGQRSLFELVRRHFWCAVSERLSIWLCAALKGLASKFCALPRPRQRSSPPASGLSLLALVLWRDEPNRPLGRIGWRHELVDRLDELLELIAGIPTEGVVRQCK